MENRKGDGVRLLREYIRALLNEDPMGFVHDLAAASDEFGVPGEGFFFGGNPGKGGGKAIKRAFNANADHQWLSTLDTVHWGYVSGLEELIGKGKDELSTTMSLPDEPLRGMFTTPAGLWVKGRITLAANNQDELFTGHFSVSSDPARVHQAKSSGINKLPRVSKDYSGYGNLKRDTELGNIAARNIPYVLDQSMWAPAKINEALVDNWKPVGFVVNDKWKAGVVVEMFGKMDPGGAPGALGKLFRLSKEFNVPIYDMNRTKLWSPE